MTDYTHYTSEDFLADESFGNYLLQKDEDCVVLWKNWIRDNPDCLDKVSKAEYLFFLLRDQHNVSTSDREIDKNFDILLSQIQQKENPSDNILLSHSNISVRKIAFKRIAIWTAAAAAIFLIGFSFWLYSNSHGIESVEYTLYAQTFDEPESVTLEDGTVINLNTHSTVSIAKNYDKTKRQISLSGSAFFKVAKDPARPFTVASGHIKTTALGTSFYIYNLHTQNTTVALLEGKVKVEGPENFIELVPGEKAFLLNEKLLHKNSFDEQQLEDFIHGNISFRGASINQIKTTLGDYFNMQVVVQGNVPEVSFTGNFKAGKLSSILEALKFTYDIHYNINGQTIILSFK